LTSTDSLGQGDKSETVADFLAFFFLLTFQPGSRKKTGRN
jgi:hypothetical protein